MHQTMNQIMKLKPQINLIIEIKDARAVIASDNYQLSAIFTNKPILKIYLKKDLADPNLCPKLSFNSFDSNTRDQIIAACETALDSQLKKAQNKGMLNPILQILVCGLPNLGKSTIINKLVRKNVALTADTPGLTKKFTAFKFHKNMWVYDTPGVFYKKVSNEQIGYQLALIGAIKRELIPLQETLKYAYQFLSKNYYHLLTNLVNQPLNHDFDQFLLLLAQKQNFKIKNNNWDLDKTMWYFYDLIRTGKIGPISWTLSNDNHW
ncbi:Ribosome biogenesis GTPase YlqF [[Mycoplasma] cavipharyngis]